MPSLPPPPRSRTAFSLAALFYLLGLAAVLLAMAQVAIRGDEQIEPEAAAAAALGGALVGAIVGLVIGLRQVRWLRGMFIGPAIGLPTGALGGAALVVPRGAVVALIGGVLLIAFGLLVRLASRRSAADESAPPP